jgi:hypothetical protein
MGNLLVDNITATLWAFPNKTGVVFIGGFYILFGKWFYHILNYKLYKKIVNSLFIEYPTITEQ